MKKITSIVLFASIFAVAVGTLGLSGISATPLMVSAAPQTQENVGMLGHVEYKVLDEFGAVKAYMQNDNVVVEAGKDCASQGLFTNSGGQVGQCITDSAAFTYIGIGNGSSATINVVNQTLADADADTDLTTVLCSDNGAGAGTAGGGDMARRNVTAVFDATGTNTIVTLDTSSDPFTFDVSNATSVIDSGIFNADYAGIPEGDHTCIVATSQTAGADWNMFSRQLLNAATGITVGAGDSLSVKWTITVG
jgi:hypothetical protein